MIITFVLPKVFAGGAQKLIGLMRRESFEGAQPLGGDNVRGHQHVNMIWHHNVCVKIIALKPAVSSVQSADQKGGEFLVAAESVNHSSPCQEFDPLRRTPSQRSFAPVERRGLRG